MQQFPLCEAASGKRHSPRSRFCERRSDRMEPKIVIIGAGPTGLGAAYRLKELGYKNFHMYERSDHLGGLASSFTDSAGFTWDIGGHVMFSHYKYYDKIFDELMGSDFQQNMRECWCGCSTRGCPTPSRTTSVICQKKSAMNA